MGTERLLFVIDDLHNLAEDVKQVIVRRLIELLPEDSNKADKSTKLKTFFGKLMERKD